MESLSVQIGQQLPAILKTLEDHPHFSRCKLLVVGCSTSEVAGQRIGTAGTEEVAARIFRVIMSFADRHKLKVAFQCCEHLNRALVTDVETMVSRGYEEVAAVPVRTAGGAMAAYAYRHLPQPVLVEHVEAEAGIDIGETLIGMHLKHVAVPVRPVQNNLGHARVTLAITRPKLIGGGRAVYEIDGSCT